MIRKHLVIGVWLLGLSLTGCATYERRPLELERYVENWSNREISVDSTREYAETLAHGEEDVPYDPSDGLSLAEAEAVALVFNPRLRLARAQAEVPLASARQAGWWPDPEFEAKVMRFVNRGSRTKFRFDGASFGGVNTGIVANGGSTDGVEMTSPGYRRVEGDYIDDPWIVTASLSITIPVSGRLAVEQDWTWAEYAVSWRRILISEWELLTRLRARWLEWSTTRERIEVLGAFVEQLGAVLLIAQFDQAASVRPLYGFGMCVVRISMIVGLAGIARPLRRVAAHQAGHGGRGKYDHTDHKHLHYSFLHNRLL